MPITDDFNRADGDPGGGWELVRGSAWAISGNVIKPTGTNQETAIRRTENFSGDHYSQCKSEYTDPLQNNSRGGAAVRVQSNGDCYRATFQHTGANGDVTLRKVVGGVSTFLNDWLTALTSFGTLYTVKVEVVGSLISVSFEGTLLGSVTDTDLTGGKPGMVQLSGGVGLQSRHDDFQSSDPLVGQGWPMPGALVEIPVDVQKVTNSPFKSDLIALNNARRATLIVQTSASLSAGQWVLKGSLTNDLSIGGQILATVNFPATPGRVASQMVKVAHKLAYVEQITPPTGGTVEKISVLLQ